MLVRIYLSAALIACIIGARLSVKKKRKKETEIKSLSEEFWQDLYEHLAKERETEEGLEL